MRIVFASRLCTAKMYNFIMKDESVKNNQQIQKLNGVLVDGLQKNNIQVIVYSERPINVRNCNMHYIPPLEEECNGIKYYYSRGINIPILSAVYAILSSFFWVIFHVKKDDDRVLLDTYALALAIGTITACKIKCIPCIAFITDVPTKSTFYVGKKRISIKSKFNDWLISKADAMIFVTRQMNDILNSMSKPYIVMEGFADSNVAKIPNLLENKYKKKTIMYTGSLTKAYGIDILIEGYIIANIPESQLIIYGAGPYVNEIKKISITNQNIIYGGVKPNNVIIREQMRASLLVNPRYTNNEFTMYSFPGKNLEYMASGTPTLTTDLPGMPDEYRNHVFILKNESAEGIAEKLREIFEMNENELHDKGLEARAWMLREKNNVKQTARIIEFLGTIFR